MGHFRALRAWQEARRLAALSNAAIDQLPFRERFALADQWRRAVHSVALNLAEGAGRRSPKEFRRFASAARGSLDELDAIFELVESVGYLETAGLTELRRVRDNCSCMVSGLVRRLDGIITRNA
ncbi:MAG TPA: four helix bundle protein [Gemmatimonadales bacterium]